MSMSVPDRIASAHVCMPVMKIIMKYRNEEEE